jgi:uncharacterized protein with PIN domain
MILVYVFSTRLSGYVENIAPGKMFVATKIWFDVFCKNFGILILTKLSKLNYRSIAIVIRHHPTTTQFIEVITNLDTRRVGINFSDRRGTNWNQAISLSVS